MHTANLIMDFQGHRERISAEVTGLGKNQMVLRYTWLKCHNPTIDWIKGVVKMDKCPPSCRHLQDKSKFMQHVEHIEGIAAEKAYHLRAADISEKPKMLRTAEEIIPPQFHKYLKVFSEKEAERFPVKKPWDHAIDLKESFVPKKGRNIPLSHDEQEEVSKYLDEQLAKGYIRPSKSPQTSPIFFIPKKEGKKHMVTDYWYLNEHTVKNNYPLPLISQLVDKLQGAKMFTKMDV